LELRCKRDVIYTPREGRLSRLNGANDNHSRLHTNVNI
jgi:hypothetical protein